MAANPDEEIERLMKWVKQALEKAYEEGAATGFDEGYEQGQQEERDKHP